jgi:6-pyruvoyltetrahydropterin/6-carboxytetrahydropterin synthase
MEIFKKYTFDCAHYLPNVSEDHKCKKVHGHTYHLTLYFEGEIDLKYGWIIDFADIKKIVEPTIQLLDHTFLNEIEGLENPTCERMSEWLWNQIKPKISVLSKIKLKETPTSGAIYKGI